MIPKRHIFFLLITVSFVLPTKIFAQDTTAKVINDYQWISYRGSADIIDTGGTRTCNFFLVNRTDSIIYLNVHSMGIEIARAVFTLDSITYVNKLTYQYFQDSYAPLNKILPFDFNFFTVQAMFNGETEKLPQGKKFSFEYLDYNLIDDSNLFFNEFIFKDLNRVIEVHGKIKNIKINKPGPTSIRIPDKFERISL